MKNKIFIAVLIMATILGCAGKAKKEANEVRTPESISLNDQTSAAPQPTEKAVAADNKEAKTVAIPDPKAQLKLIRTADISFEVRDFDVSRKKIMEAIRKRNAYISGENQDNSEYKINSDLIIRVSNENFDALLSDLDQVYYRLSFKKVKAEDVSEEYVDIESRLKTKKEAEKRYLEILGKAKTIDDIIKMEEIIRVIQEEIEAKEGRLKFLNDRVAFSTINLNVYETKDYKFIPEKKPGFFQQLWKALNTGWAVLVRIFIALLYLWPLYVLAGVITWFIWKNRKKRKLANSPKSPESPAEQ